MVIAIFLNLIVISSAFFMATAFFKKERAGEVILSTFLLAFSQIIIVELIWGMLSKLYYANIVASHTGIFLINLLYFYRKQPRFSLKPDTAFVMQSNILMLGLAFFLGFYVVLFWFNMINPIPFTDAMLYHLPYPVYWLKNANLINPLVINDYGNSNPCGMNILMYYPVNAEMLFFWLILPLKNAFLADLGQIPFYIIGSIAIYLILRKFNVNKSIAFLTAILWALIPNLIKQISKGAMIDVIVAVTFILVIFYLLDLKDRFSFKNSLLFGLSLGIFIGTKATSIFWTLSIAPLIIYIFWKNLRKSDFLLCIFTVVIAALVFGGRTYIRNFLLYHNLFYPITVKLFGHIIMPGQADKAVFNRIVYPAEEFTMRKLFFGEGLGVQFLMFIVPGTVLPLVFSPFFKKRFIKYSDHILFFLIPLIMAYLYFFVMQGFWVRYLFPYLALGFMAMVIFLEKSRWGRIYFWVFGFISIFASCAEINRRGQLIASLVLSLILFASFKFYKKIFIVKINKSIKYATSLLLFLALIISLVRIEENYDRNVFKKFPQMFSKKERKEADTAWAWAWLDEHTAAGTRIAYTGRAESYPLFGTHYKNDVFYVSINNKPPLPHCYLKGDYRGEKDPVAWKNNLRDYKIDYLFVYQPYDRTDYPIEDEWAKADTQIFNLAYSNTRVRIYKVNLNKENNG